MLHEIDLEHELLQDLNKQQTSIEYSLDLSNKSVPPITSTNSDPAMERNGTPASAATALANKVFPIPGGPSNKAPLGTFAPNS